MLNTKTSGKFMAMKLCNVYEYSFLHFQVSVYLSCVRMVGSVVTRVTPIVVSVRPDTRVVTVARLSTTVPPCHAKMETARATV